LYTIKKKLEDEPNKRCVRRKKDQTEMVGRAIRKELIIENKIIWTEKVSLLNKKN
jgi:hypothetical protein